MELTKELIRPCLKTILMRVLLQTLMAIGVLWAVHLWIGDNMLLNLAIISYMSAPATFSMQTFLKRKRAVPMYQQPILCTVWCRFWYISFWQQWFIRSVKRQAVACCPVWLMTRMQGLFFKSSVSRELNLLEWIFGGMFNINFTFCQHFIIIRIRKALLWLLMAKINSVIFHSMIQFFMTSHHNFYFYGRILIT